MHINRLRTAITAALVLTAAACTIREEPVTRDDVVVACLAFEETVGTRFGECLGWSAQMTAEYILRNQEECQFDVRAETCWANQHRSYESCEDRTAGKSCDELCPNGFCLVSCPYVCPEP
jgi:hypothetical protein